MILLVVLILGDLGFYLWSSQAASSPPPGGSATSPSAGDPATPFPALTRADSGFAGGRFGDVATEELVQSRDTYYAALNLLLDYSASKDRALLRQALEKLKSLEAGHMNVYSRSGLMFGAWCREQLGDTAYRDRLVSEGLFNDTHYRFLFSSGLPTGAIRYQIAQDCHTAQEELQRAIDLYRAAHAGSLPPRLEDLVTESPRGLIRCPASSGNAYGIDAKGFLVCREHPPQRPEESQEEEQAYKVHLMLLDGYTETERLDRMWDDLVKVSGLHEGQTVADVGCGPGLFTFPMATKVGPQGKVFAVDINRSVLDFVAFAASERPGLNIETFLTSKSELTLPPESVELITVIETYHSMVSLSDPSQKANLQGFLLPWLRSVRRALKPGGLLVIGDGNVDVRLVREQVTLAGFEPVPTPAPGVKLRNLDYYSVFRRPLDEP